MNPFTKMLLLTTASGACILAGGLLARIERIRPLWLEQELRHTIIAFGGGILMAAIAFVLAAEGRACFDASLWGVALLMLGGVVFMQIERYLSAKSHQLSQTLAMPLDFIISASALRLTMA